MAAVKVLSVESKQGVKEFLTEIKVISSIEHENLVKLYGCCAEGDHRILVYNYLENNSLSQTLLGELKSFVIVIFNFSLFLLFGLYLWQWILMFAYSQVVPIVASRLAGKHELKYALVLHEDLHSSTKKPSLI